MSLISSLYAGQTGLDTSSTALQVIGDNISNSSTIGFKESRAAFEDLLAQNMIGGDGGGGGLGARLQSVQQILTQGSITSTGNTTDLALQGNGFFMVNGPSGQFLTRDGQFTTDKTGVLTNLDGFAVQGFAADPTGKLSGTVGDLNVGNATSLPNATTTVTLQANLQADAAVPSAPWDPANAAATSNFSASTQVFDAQGKEHDAQVYFSKTGAGAWDFHVMTDGSGVAGGTAGTPSEIGTGSLTFDASGKLASETQSSSFTPSSSTVAQALTFNFGDPTGTAGGTGVAGITQFASASSITFASQDGYGAGNLAGIAVDASGDITGSFTNGESRVLGQVAVATVPAPDQLQRESGNLYQVTPGAGQISVGAAGQGGRGSVVAGALEQSNVDLAGQFVDMIVAQRAFQADSRTITTADSLLQELIQMKR
jgi:flagellar hook protein FlgE